MQLKLKKEVFFLPCIRKESFFDTSKLLSVMHEQSIKSVKNGCVWWVIRELSTFCHSFFTHFVPCIEHKHSVDTTTS